MSASADAESNCSFLLFIFCNGPLLLAGCYQRLLRTSFFVAVIKANEVGSKFLLKQSFELWQSVWAWSFTILGQASALPSITIHLYNSPCPKNLTVLQTHHFPKMDKNAPAENCYQNSTMRKNCSSYLGSRLLVAALGFRPSKNSEFSAASADADVFLG